MEFGSPPAIGTRLAGGGFIIKTMFPSADRKFSCFTCDDMLLSGAVVAMRFNDMMKDWECKCWCCFTLNSSDTPSSLWQSISRQEIEKMKQNKSKKGAQREGEAKGCFPTVLLYIY